MANKSFLEKMFAEGENNTISHKRVVSFVSITMLCILSLLSAFGFPCATECYYLFAGLAGGESMLTTVEKTAKTIKSVDSAVNNKEEESSED